MRDRAATVDTVELRAERGRAVLIGAPELFEPPTALAGALDEWAEVAAAVCADGSVDPATAELVSARGRQLAARLADAAGTAVRYTDPVRGVPERVPAPDADACPPAEPDHIPGRTPERMPGQTPQRTPGQTPERTFEQRSQRAFEQNPEWAPDEPTPWATGLVVSGFVAVLVLIAVVALVRGLGDVAWWLGALALAVVTAGLAPSVWMARHMPLWRWFSYGVGGGLALSWFTVLLSTLGP